MCTVELVFGQTNQDSGFNKFLREPKYKNWVSYYVRCTQYKENSGFHKEKREKPEKNSEYELSQNKVSSHINKNFKTFFMLVSSIDYLESRLQ